MSDDFITSRTQAYNQRNQDKITLSVRLSVKEDLILQELADVWETTRQDIIHDLISEYVIKAWENKRLEDQHSENSSEELPKEMNGVQYFLLNTNKANDIADHDFMIEQKVAAAFEDGYKEKIKRIKQGDFVFLYESGKGIVAYGKACGEVQKTHHYGVENKTYFQTLDEFVDLSRMPIKAKDIKSILGRSFPFAQTLSKMVDGDKLLMYIEKLLART